HIARRVPLFPGKDNLESELNIAENTIETKNSQIEQLESNINELQNQLSLVENKINEVKTELNSFEEEVQESMDWFSDNSNINNFNQFSSLRSQMMKCVRAREDGTCLIKLACFDLIHEKYKEFTYSKDIITSNKSDKLQSLGEFYDHEKGDCEDFSLLVKGEINAMKEFCEERGADEFIFEVAYPKAGSEYFVDFKEEWYYSETTGVQIPSSHENVYVVCGNYPVGADPNSFRIDVSGHCALGFTDKKIESSKDIKEALFNSIIMEPQTGFLTFDQRNENYLFVPDNGESTAKKAIYAWAIITDDDYYLFDREKLVWKGYKDFLPVISNMRTELDSINNN
ncbi:MAG: coiled-coil domain-containing protein, partial [Candidatus Woesearchaeota archaeon]